MGAAIFSPLLVDKVTSNKVTSLHGVSHLFTFSPFHLLQAFHFFTFSRFHHFPFTDGFLFDIGKTERNSVSFTASRNRIIPISPLN